MTREDPRSALKDARRIVVKIGSRAILGHDGAAGARFAMVASQVARLIALGHTPAVVSSGAVALGYPRLGFDARPRAVAELQAAAAAGQSGLIRAYETAFAEHGFTVGQVLLTHGELAVRGCYLRARATLETLLSRGVVPIINENDTVSVEELTFGDNDRLAALVAALLSADLLVLLSDVEGLLDERSKRVSLVSDVREAEALVRPMPEGVSLGGMGSKLQAAWLCSRRGLPMVIAGAGEPGVLERVVRGEDVGTLFVPEGTPLASRKHWIAFTLKPQGSLVVDAGAIRALQSCRSSLLPAGIVSVRGQFRLGDCVRIVDADGREVARGLVRYDANDVRTLAGVQTHQIEGLLGHYGGDEIVHRDDLVQS